MFDHDDEGDLFGVSSALESLSELERNTNAAVMAQRTSQRVEIQAKIVIQPGNSSERQQCRLEGVTADISDGGCMALLPQPLLVGDFYWATIQQEQLDVGSLLARCLRCRLIREDAFEVGFRFMNDIDLNRALASGSESLF